MEAEVREILTEAVREPSDRLNLAQAIIARFGELGGAELELPPRGSPPRAAEFPE